VDGAAFFTVLTIIHAFLVVNESSVHMRLIFARFMHAVLRYDPDTKPTDFAVSTVIKLTLLIVILNFYFS